jgi:N utilization substance protein B
MNPEDKLASRRLARLAAVQALYQMEVSGATVEDVQNDFLTGKLPREEAGFSEREGDLDLFKLLVTQAVSRQTTIDRAIARRLSQGWRLERLDAVARAILRAGVVELEQCPETPVAVAINEFVEISKDFFDGPEPGFINATLDACGRDVRQPL